MNDCREMVGGLSWEGAQGGLSRRRVLARRGHYRRVCHGCEIERGAGMRDRELDELLLDPGIIRNRLKVYSTRDNAIAALEAIEEFGSLDVYLWSFVDGNTVINRWRDHTEVPATTELSERMSKALKKRGFRFVGSTICYSLMQATGMVNDHLVTCFRHPQASSGHR